MLVVLIISILVCGEAHHDGCQTTCSEGKGHVNEYSDGRTENLHENVSEITRYTNLVSSGVIRWGNSVGSLRENARNEVPSTTDSLYEEKSAQEGFGDAGGEQSLDAPKEEPRKPDEQAQKTWDAKIFVNGRKISGVLRHFWRSTGLCPPSPHTAALPFLLSQDERLNLALIASLPNDAISQVRIHWLLDLVNGSIENGRPAYNFTQLDVLMDLLHQHRLRPGFELMGNPGRIFDDLENETQLLWWRDLVARTAERYVGRYGLKWVASWRWETWNEPDHRDFDDLSFTVRGFLNYYDASRAGLDDVSGLLRLGGPGGSCREPGFSRTCWALLRHCDRGSSVFAPGIPPRIDFISFHVKGHEDADSILTKELLTLRVIRSTFPNLRHVPVVNDEGDFLKGWWKGLEWRADDRYAALVVRAVYVHLLLRVSVPQYELISFDNAFLNYRPSFFDQRTLLARFQINSTTPRQVQLVKKASYSVMALMSILGDRLLPHVVQGGDSRLSIISSCRNCQREPAKRSAKGEYSQHEEPRTSKNSNPCSNIKTPEGRMKELSAEDAGLNETAIGGKKAEETSEENIRRDNTTENGNSSGEAERRSGMNNGSWEATVLVSLSNGTEKSTRDGTRVKVMVALPKALLGGVVAAATYQLGGGQIGPYEAWLDLGRPEEPTRAQLALIRSFEGSRRTGPRMIEVLRPNLGFRLKRLLVPDVRVIHLCQTSTSNPGKVTGVKTVGVTAADVLLTWSDARINTRCVLRYEMERSVAGRGGPYARIGGRGAAHDNFWYSLPALRGPRTVQGWYRVRVVTYWGTKGPFSEPAYHHVE